MSLLKHVDRGMLKVIWSTFQITSTVAWNLNVIYPKPFSELLFTLSFLQLDFLSLDCARGETNYFARVLVVTLTPVVMAVAIAISMWCRLIVAAARSARRSAQIESSSVSPASVLRFIRDSMGNRRSRSLSSPLQGSGTQPSQNLRDSVDFAPGEENQQQQQIKQLAKTEEETIKAQHAYAFLLLSYLVLPPVSMMQFQSLDCITLDHDGSRFLRADSSIDVRLFFRFACFVCYQLLIPPLFRTMPFLAFTYSIILPSATLPNTGRLNYMQFYRSLSINQSPSFGSASSGNTRTNSTLLDCRKKLRFVIVQWIRTCVS